MMLLPLAAAAAPANYRALGTEPFWSLTIGGRTMRFERPDAAAVTVRRPAVRRSFNQRRFVTRRMAVTVTHVRCSDGMSDRVYADRVTVTVGRTTYRGCGGASLAAVPRQPAAVTWPGARGAAECDRGDHTAPAVRQRSDAAAVRGA